MADTQPFKARTVYDRVSTFEKGMNSGSDPLLIPKNQVAFSANATVRDGFITTRPTFNKNFNFTWPSDEVKNAVERGLFQGAAYYQPDSGNESLFAQISGRLFQFVILESDVTVIERTIPGDPNPASSTQAWMWQSENFLIINDGSSLPIFFDGSTTRRSYGPTHLLATQNAGPVTKPTTIGEQVTLTLLAPYPGPFNVPVLVGGEYYQPIQNTSGYLVDAVCLYDVPGTPIAVGGEVATNPAVAFVVAVAANPVGSFYFPNVSPSYITLTLTTPFTGPLESSVIMFGKIWVVRTIGPGNSVRLLATQAGTYSPIAAGDKFFFSASSSPAVSLGSVTVAAVAPSIGATVQIRLSSSFSGTPGQIVYIGTKGQYAVTAVPDPAGTTSLTLINLSNLTAGNFVSAEIMSVPELPAGRMGAYGLGQNWMCLTDGLSFICSDITRGPSGTPANNYRDSVLKTTDLTFNGGNFAIPGAGNVITSMTFIANLDRALGQGPLMIGTAKFMASCAAPINFETIAVDYPTGPILTFALIGTGPLGQNSTVLINSDVFFRSRPGFGSLVLGRRDFNSPGNSPISEEVVRILNPDNKSLLAYGSAINFDNRWLITVSPQASSQGVLHAGLSVLNLDPVSGMGEKQPPVYDGLWTGVNALQFVQGEFNSRARAFAFTFNVTLSKIELYELNSGSVQKFDNGTTPITWTFETAQLFREDVKPVEQLISLRDGEFAVSEVVGNVRFVVYYKSDQGCWTLWHQFSICADQEGEPQYFPRLGLGEPSSDRCDPVLNQPLRNGYNFQVKFVITGYCRFLRARFEAVTIQDPKFQRPICDELVEV